MNFRRFFYLIGLLAAVGSTEADVLLSDFNGTQLAYTYGSWTNAGSMLTNAAYLTITNPATVSGGGGIWLASNTSFNATSHEIRVVARLGNANSASVFRIGLGDKDGSGSEEFKYEFASSMLNTETFTTLSVPVMAYVGIYDPEVDGDTIPNFDPATNGLGSWEFQGNYDTNETANIFNIDVDNVDIHYTGNMLKDPGFEYTLAVPETFSTNWWKYGDCGQEWWAGEGGLGKGVAFHSWTNEAFGGFGQNVPVDLVDGDTFTFSIRGFAQSNYSSASSQTCMRLEFWSSTTQVYSVTNDIYADFHTNHSWAAYTISHRNRDESIDMVKPVVFFSDASDTGGNQAAKWDNACFSQIEGPPPAGQVFILK